MLLGFLIGGAVCVVGVLAGGGIVMLAFHMDRRASADSDSLSRRKAKSSEEKDRAEEKARPDSFERDRHPAFRV